MSIHRPPHLFVLLGVVLLAALLWFVLSAGETGLDGGEALDREGIPAPADPSLRGHEPGAGAPDAVTRGTDVEVVDARGVPVEGAVVRTYATALDDGSFHWAGVTDPLRPRDPHAKGRTGADGHVRLKTPPAGGRITATAEGFAQGLGWAPPAEEDDRGIRIVIRAAHALHGRVIDADGVAIEGALVSTAASRMGSSSDLRHLPHSVTDSAGAYRLEGLAPGTVHLAVAREGATMRDVVTVRIPEITNFDIVLPATTVLRGRVTHEGSGEPVQGAVVAARVGNGWDAQRIEARATTDEEGAYEITSLPPVRLLEVEAVHESLVQTVPPGETHGREIRLDADRPVVWDLALRPGAFILVTVQGVDSPADLRVVARPRDRRRGGGARAVAGSDGRFRCGPLLGDTYEVRIDSWRYAATPVEVEVEDGGTANLTLTAEGTEEETALDDEPGKRTVTVRGTVRSEDGAAVPGAWVGAQEAGPHGNIADRPFEWTPLTAHTAGRDGSFELTYDVWTGAFEVIASAPGFAPSKPVVVRLAPEQEEYEADVVLDRGHAAEVMVTDATTSRPVAGAMASLVIPAEHGGHIDWIDGPPPPAVHAVGDADGSFRIEHVRPGAYRLAVAAIGYVPTRQPLTVPATAPVQIVLQPALDLGGRVVFDDGTNPGVVALVLDAANGDHHRRTATRKDGTFRFRGIPAGRYTLEVDQAFNSTLNILEETVGPFEAGRRDIVVTVHRGLTIEGRVVTTDGEGIWGATVSADDEEGMAAGHLAWSKKDGTFELVGLPKGRVRLEVKANGYLSRETDWLEPGARGVVVTLPRGGTIAGVIIDEKGKPVGGLYIAAVEPESDGYVDTDAPTAKTDEEGRFEITGILIPRVELAIRQNFDMRVLLAATSVQVGVSDIRVVCSKGAIITGVVLDEQGRPFAGARLTASPPTYGSCWVATSDAKGNFTIEGLFPDREYEIEVEWFDAVDESENSLDGFEARGGDTDVEIRLE